LKISFNYRTLVCRPLKLLFVTFSWLQEKVRQEAYLVCSFSFLCRQNEKEPKRKKLVAAPLLGGLINDGLPALAGLTAFLVQQQS